MMAKPEYINIRICPTTNVLISDNLPVRKSYFDSNIIARILRRFFSTDYFDMDDVSNLIYHKFSYGAVSYTLYGKNVNIMLE